MIHIETERLLLRDWQEEDRLYFQRMNKSKEVMRYFVRPLQYEETDNLLKNIEKELKEENYGLYAVEAKETNSFIGFIGFHKVTFVSDFTPCIEIAWRLDQRAWGKGYATEGARACLDHGINKLKIEQIYSFTSVLNEASQNVMEKIGLQYVKDFNHPNVPKDNPLYKQVLYTIKSVK